MISWRTSVVVVAVVVVVSWRLGVQIGSLARVFHWQRRLYLAQKDKIISLSLCIEESPQRAGVRRQAPNAT